LHLKLWMKTLFLQIFRSSAALHHNSNMLAPENLDIDE